MIAPERVIERIGWITQMKSTPPLTKEYIERHTGFLKIMLDSYKIMDLPLE
jgi:hypothetical protein